MLSRLNALMAPDSEDNISTIRRIDSALFYKGQLQCTLSALDNLHKMWQMPKRRGSVHAILQQSSFERTQFADEEVSMLSVNM